MSVHHVKYLLIGGGLASSAAAKAIRERDPEGEMLLVGQEVVRPYYRPALSKDYLLGRTPKSELFAAAEGWFASKRIELQTGRRVAHLDVARRAATLDSGEVISFDQCLIATGASPKHLNVPGADLPNLFYLRSLADADRLHNAIEKAKREGRPQVRGGGRGRAVVIGSGVLSAELAATFTQLGLETELVTGATHPWYRFAGENTGKFLQRYLEKHGVAVHCGRRVQRIEGDGRTQRVVLPSETAAGDVLPCDLAVAAIGIVVNKEILRGTPILAERAILTDDHCRTSEPFIYAAGDCAAVYDPLFGKHRVLDHWENAQVTGTLAGNNMAGADEAYSAVNSFFSEVFDLSLVAWGEAKLVERRLLRWTPTVESPEFVEIGVAKDGRVAQVLAVRPRGGGSHPEDALLGELVRRRLLVDGNQEQMKDPAVPLAQVLAE